jgi:opacity protein-like surface antigen
MEKITDSDLKRFAKFRELFGDGITKEEFVDSFENVVKLVLEMSKKLDIDSGALRRDYQAFKRDLKTANAATFVGLKEEAEAFVGASINRIVSTLQSRLDQAETDIGKLRSDVDAVSNGKAGDEERLLEKMRLLIPSMSEIENGLPRLASIERDVVEINAALREAVKAKKPITFVGGARGIYLYVGGVKKGIMNTLNFVAGTNMAIAHSRVNGRDTITFTASGGGTTVETPAETVNGSTTVFTVTAQPKWIVADGITYYEGAGYSYSSLQVTMDIAPSSFIRAII